MNKEINDNNIILKTFKDDTWQDQILSLEILVFSDKDKIKILEKYNENQNKLSDSKKIIFLIIIFFKKKKFNILIYI
jgi:hypothetical protein